MKLFLGTLFVAVLCGGTNGAKYCCYPPVWESLNFFRQGAQINGSIISMVGEEMVSVDTTVMMVNSMASITSDSVTTDVRTLQDFNGGKQYQIIGGTCKVTALGNYTNKCVPDDAVLVVKAAFGAGNNTLGFDVYNINRGKTSVSLDVTAVDCVPVAVNVYGSIDGGNGLSSKLYTNFTLGIADRSVFKIPPICQKASYEAHHEVHSMPIHGLF